MNPDTKSIANLFYHAAVLSGLTVAYSMLGKKLLKFNVGSPSNADLTDSIKLAAAVSAAMISKDYIEKSKIIPPNIVPI